MASAAPSELRLTVRTPDSVTDPRVETVPARLKGWLAGLPMADPATAARQLLDQLGLLNRQHLEPALRVTLLDLYAATYRKIDRVLAQRLPATDLRQLRRRLESGLPELCTELAYGYKHALLDSRAEPPAGPRGQLLAVAAVRTVRLLGHELLLAYAAYQDPPKRVWLELNSLYRFAEQSGFAAARVPQPGHSRGESSVLDSYLQLLLLARHDPYRIPAGEVWQVYHYLDQWAGLCRLEPVDSAAGNGWCVDLDRAQPDATDGGGEHLRRIVPRALQQHLERQLVTLRAGSMPESLGLGDEVGVDSAREILKRMQRTWFAPDERRNQRHAKSDRVRVLCGLSAICRGHDEPEANAPADEDWILGKGQQPAFEMGNRRADPRYLEWHVLNRSRGGLMLRTGSGHGRWLSIGQLVAIDFRLQEQPQWLTCAVRWLRFGRDERVELGVQFVSARAHPVTVRYREEDGGRPVSRQALLIDGEPDSQLIGDRGLFSAERFIEIPGQQPARFVTSRLLETTRSYQRIQISPLLSTRRS